MPEIKMLQTEDLDRWDRFVISHEFGSIYHTSSWQSIIKSSFGHRPIYLYMEDESGEIRAGLPMFEITSKLFGKRLTSLPCAQACNPLVSNPEEMEVLLSYAIDNLARGRHIKYIELKTDGRYQFSVEKLGNPLKKYSTYILDIGRALDEIQMSFHKSCIQRSIRKSHKSGLELVTGDSVDDMSRFFELYLRMRKRNGLLPLPRKFFLNIWEKLSPRGCMEILHARHGGHIISSILLLKFNDTVTYEYGATDPESLHLRPSHFLFWEAIKRYKDQNYKSFDFGRTSDDNRGLSTFKSRWGARQEALPYYYIPEIRGLPSVRQRRLTQQLMYHVVSNMPQSLCHSLGSVLYKRLV